MSWNYNARYKGIPFEVASEHPLGRGDVVGFLIHDEQTVKAIRDRDERILDLLNWMVDEIDTLSLSRWATDISAIEFWRDKKSLDEFGQIINTILDSYYIEPTTRKRLELELDWVSKERQIEAQKLAKAEYSQRRRSEFSRNYDQLMLALIQRDGYRCVICDTIEDLTIDHIIPLSKGGTDELSNLRILCRTHNSSKGDKDAE
jgi:hypothetical protein